MTEERFHPQNDNLCQPERDFYLPDGDFNGREESFRIENGGFDKGPALANEFLRALFAANQDEGMRTEAQS